MVQVVSGNIFKSRSDAIFCPVNLRGYMGALAAKFQELYPTESAEYQKRAAAGKILMGDLLMVSREPTPDKPAKFIGFFPTVIEPGGESQEFFIVMGLQTLEGYARNLKLQTVALPALGCGVGGLKFEDVQRMVHSRFAATPINVFLYRPLDAEETRKAA